jgi:ATP-binding cassette subfamily F protein uup
VTSTFVFEGGGRVQEYVGGYTDWLAQRPASPAVSAPAPPARPAAPAGESRPQRVKLSYKEARELEQLPGEIEALEQAQRELTARMSGADYHQQGATRIREDRAEAERLERLLEGKFARWAELDAKASQQR